MHEFVSAVVAVVTFFLFPFLFEGYVALKVAKND